MLVFYSIMTTTTDAFGYYNELENEDILTNTKLFGEVLRVIQNHLSEDKDLVGQTSTQANMLSPILDGQQIPSEHIVRIKIHYVF